MYSQTVGASSYDGRGMMPETTTSAGAGP